MTDRFVNIHTHRPTGRGIEPRTAGIHPWNADKEDVSTIVPLLGEVQAVGETGLDFVRGADRAAGSVRRSGSSASGRTTFRTDARIWVYACQFVMG